MTTLSNQLIALEKQFAKSLLDLAGALTADMHDVAQRHIVDFLGVALAGTTAAPVERMIGMVKDAGPVAAGKGGAVLGQADRIAMTDAVFINAMAGHIHDFDDDETLLSIAHVTVPVVAAAWTLGCASGASGRQIAAAYTAGVEAMMRIGQMINPEHYRRGWHSSATLGAFGAATATAILSGFDAGQLMHALRFAATTASGLRKSFGSDAKSIQLGRSAANGYRAAQIAAAGATTSDGMLFATGGYVDLYGGDTGRVAEAVAMTGRPAGMISPGITIKAYPSCTATHTAIESVLTLCEQHAIDWTRIERLTVSMGIDLPTVLPYDRPQIGLEGKFSMRYCVAGAARYGKMGIDQFTDAATQEAGVQRMLDRTQVVLDHDTPRPAVGLADQARVTIEMQGGEVFERFLSDTLGSAKRPMSAAVLKDKFVACVAPVLGAPTAEAAFVALGTLADVADIRSIPLSSSTPGTASTPAAASSAAAGLTH